MRAFQAELQLMAVQLQNGQYQPIRSGLHWQLVHENLKSAEKNPHVSEAAEPLFSVMPGIYRLIVRHHHQEKIIQNVQLVAGKKTSQIVLFGDAAEIREGENYHIDEAVVNKETEYERRQLERVGERQYGLAASGLTQLHQQTGVGQQMLLAAHPLLSQSAQFDGVAAKLSPLPDANPVAEEAAQEKAPHLQPSPAPNMAPSPSPFSAPTMKPGR